MPLWVFFMLISLWPLVMVCFIDGMLVLSLLTHVPRIWANYRWSTWLWWTLVVVLLAVAIGTTLVIREPYVDFLRSVAAKPGAIAGLLLAGWAVFGWVVATERDDGQQRLKEETLDAHLEAFS